MCAYVHMVKVCMWGVVWEREGEQEDDGGGDEGKKRRRKVDRGEKVKGRPGWFVTNYLIFLALCI